ncbi:NAD(P)/FAD-dependent oxidoreductase [Noviherbaspirillum suwonense]|uniref:Predicted NAD/FAD-binding protein n=1 Tax=Noviherbaspirillum suwonense TaxID=1224511 RepID=A0ABY1Q5F8_9BURK|nr:FAD-dependent oxidoreductase [Noviherbaspirillum suwonense]SMP59597.1 Predicted NAD/FAD-binding protein [Noviherbaspirillum suwonense]
MHRQAPDSSPSAGKPEGRRIAVVGAGIAGLASAWLLSSRHDVTLYEASDYLGGQARTVDASLDGISHPIDTGFLAFNQPDHPNFTALLDHLGVESTGTGMSISFSLGQPGLEWAGSSPATVFGQKRKLLRPRFWRVLADLSRFNRQSVAWLAAHPHDNLSLRDFLQAGGYSDAFAAWCLMPMGAAVWPCASGQVLDYPLASFVRFCRNHGLMQAFGRPAWRAVAGGGRECVRKLAAGVGRIRLACPVRHVHRAAFGALVETADDCRRYDDVVLACHSEQALALLGRGATGDERRLLQAIRYEASRAVLHTDTSLLPRNPALWSTWNYRAASDGPGDAPYGMSCLINHLQPLPCETPAIVSMAPARAPAPGSVIAEFDYAHPLFDGAAVAAQRELAGRVGHDGIWLCGAWNGHGFHEDSLKSALRLANAMGCHAPWQPAAAAEVIGRGAPLPHAA